MKKKKDEVKTVEPSDIIKTTDDYQSSPAVKPKAQVPKDDYGNIGVRATLTNSGLNNSDIGYDGEYVTYRGSRILKPEYENDGTSFAKEADINKAINKAYSDMGKNLAPIAQTAASYGVPQYAAKYDNGNVYLGGRAVPSVYQSNGIAYGEADKIKEASDWYKEATGAVSYSDIKTDFDDYKSKMNELIDSYMEKSNRSYNPQSDPAYLAYAETAKREGQKAYEDTLGRMNARTGGYMNTAAATAASQGMNNYLEGIQDKIPEFMNQFYERYADERDAELEAIKTLNDINSKSFSDYMSMAQVADEFNRQSAVDEFNRKNDEKDLWRDSLYTDLYDDIMGLELDNMRADLRGARLSADRQQIENTISAADIPYASDMAKEKYQQAVQESIGMARENELKSSETNNKIIENNMLETERICRDAVIRGYFLSSEAEFLKINQNADPYQAYLRFQMIKEAY